MKKSSKIWKTYTIVYIYETPNNQSNKTSPEPLDNVMIKLNEINSSSILFFKLLLFNLFIISYC